MIQHSTSSDLPVLIPASVGEIARRVTADDRTGSIMGVTSRGLFVHLPPRWVIFLSHEPYRGPLTVNVALPPELPIERGDPVELSAGILNLPQAGIRIALQERSGFWVEPLRVPVPAADALRLRLRRVAVQVMAAKGGEGLSSLLASLTGLPMDSPTSDMAGLQASLLDLLPDLRRGQFTAAASLLISQVGCGSGLTPSGDDLALGFLLALNHAREWFGANTEVEQLSQALLSAAPNRTTTLSACLIEAAVLGQADERLIAGLDGLITGQSPVSEIISAFTSWGSSSGADALVGITLLLNSLPE